MYESILIPFDGSDEARKGAIHGLNLAESVGATVHALYVIDLPGTPRSLYIRDDEEELREDYRQYGEEVTQEICEMAADRGLECTTVIKSGAPGEEIVDYAEDNGMGAIVMGTAFRGTLRGLLGSTSDKVVRTSTVPVITNRMSVDE